ncbi:MAG: hypothetical protein IJW99_04520 [Clostridia bacterium]|nr:hypothetical protein [Clostridia bacterium]
MRKKKQQEIEQEALSSEAMPKENAAAADETASPRKKRHILAKILCALAATLVWVYAVNLESTDFERTFAGVPVIVDGVAQLNAENEMSVISGYDNVVDVIVSGKKSEVLAMTGEEIRVSVDVSGLTAAGKFPLPVKVDLPENFTAVNEAQLSAEIYVDVDTTREIPVRITRLAHIVSTSYTLGEPTLSVEQVTVTGPAQVLELIDCAALEIDLGNVVTATTIVGAPILQDAKGGRISNPYVRCDTGEITVNIPVTQRKQIKLTAVYAAPELADHWIAEILPDTVEVTGDPMLLANLTEVPVYVIDEKAKEGEYVVSAIELPVGVTVAEDEAKAVYVRLRHSVG